MTNRYARGKIYKLVNDVDEQIYIGSTCNNLAKRLSEHRKLAKKKPDRRVYAHLNAIGWDSVRIVLVESVTAETKDQLLAREQHYIEMLRPSLNKAAAIGSECEHGRQRCRCVDCGGSQICNHGRQRGECVDCGGSQICDHGRRRRDCVECGGSSVCEHRRQRRSCVECGGGSICEHRRQRSACALCGAPRTKRIECECGIVVTAGNLNKHMETDLHKRQFKIKFLEVFGEEWDETVGTP